jgi:hypothetical protein
MSFVNLEMQLRWLIVGVKRVDGRKEKNVADKERKENKRKKRKERRGKKDLTSSKDISFDKSS